MFTLFKDETELAKKTMSWIVEKQESINAHWSGSTSQNRLGIAKHPKDGQEKETEVLGKYTTPSILHLYRFKLFLF